MKKMPQASSLTQLIKPIESFPKSLSYKKIDMKKKLQKMSIIHQNMRASNPSMNRRDSIKYQMYNITENQVDRKIAKLTGTLENKPR